MHQTQTVWVWVSSDMGTHVTDWVGGPNPNSYTQTETPKRFGFEFGFVACLNKNTK